MTFQFGFIKNHGVLPHHSNNTFTLVPGLTTHLSWLTVGVALLLRALGLDWLDVLTTSVSQKGIQETN